MGQTTDDLLVTDITLRLTLRGDYWSSPEKWDWTGVIQLCPAKQKIQKQLQKDYAK